MPATGTALASGAVNVEQAARISWMSSTYPQGHRRPTPVAEGFLLEHARVLNADDLARLGKRIDAAVDPDGTQTLTGRDTDEVIAELRAARTALAAPMPAEDGTKDRSPAALDRPSHHHDLIHHGAWEIFLGQDRRPWLRPATWIDPGSTRDRPGAHPDPEHLLGHQQALTVCARADVRTEDRAA